MPDIFHFAAPAHWRTLDFIADLHLKPQEPRTFAAWRDYLRHTPADAVFLLGDVFEAWVGDDCATPRSFERRCQTVLRAASKCRALFFMAGNRDFLIGQKFLARAHMQPLPDPTALHFGGRRWLLSHGDALCTDDARYQHFRAQVRAPEWQAAFLARPLAERLAIAQHMRQTSEAEHAGRGYANIDETLAAQWLRAAGAATLIHGHTHQPGEYELGDGLQRAVVSDWHITDNVRRLDVLRLTADGLQRIVSDGV